MLKFAILCLVFAVSQALPGNFYQYQHRSFPNPVFQKQKEWYVPTAPSIDETYQFHALIVVNNGGFCGGILVDSNKVLTSAQCVIGGTNFEIHLNRRDLYNLDPTLNANEVLVSSSNSIVHPEFSSNHLQAINDLALLILDSPVGITPVKVGGQIFSDPLLTYIDVPLVGFGLTTDPNRQQRSMQGYLQWYSTHSKPISECIGYNPGVDNTGKHVCAEATGPSACFGDPGSPLLQYASGGIEVIGIASFGSSTPCDNYGQTVFTYVRAYHDWLAQNGVPIAQ
ncbi:chymotrypsin-like elastase family member 2A [Cloeon dipterum]|uniref:chymotrypsin-like elastase family member 2A n=1 Tax=Cloeon dipterum TaxID=197152 RepID=UPI00321FEB5D